MKTIIILGVIGLIIYFVKKLNRKKSSPVENLDTESWEYKVANAKLNLEEFETSSEEQKRDLLYYYCMKLRKSDNWGSESVINMPNVIKYFYLIETLEKEVNNGGFSQFFINSSGIFSFETNEALKEVGAVRTSQILEEAIKLIKESNKSNEEFRRIINSKNLHEFITTSEIYNDDELTSKLSELDSIFYKYEESPTYLAIKYFSENKESFFKNNDK
jgi:hypothetical protein